VKPKIALCATYITDVGDILVCSYMRGLYVVCVCDVSQLTVQRLTRM